MHSGAFPSLIVREPLHFRSGALSDGSRMFSSSSRRRRAILTEQNSTKVSKSGTILQIEKQALRLPCFLGDPPEPLVRLHPLDFVAWLSSYAP